MKSVQNLCTLSDLISRFNRRYYALLYNTSLECTNLTVIYFYFRWSSCDLVHGLEALILTNILQAS